MPGTLAAQFTMAPMRATPPYGAIKPAAAHATGGVAARPQRASEIQKIAAWGLEVRVAPAMARPRVRPHKR